MKIAFCNRPNFDNPLGGDGIQMLKTKEHLEILFPEVKIDIITNADDINITYDIVHIFNFVTYQVTNSFFEKAKRLGVPIVSSCIYWNYKFATPEIFFMVLGYPNFIGREIVECLCKLARFTGLICNYPVECRRELKKYYKKFVSLSDIILPNSNEEGKLLLEFTQLESQKNKIKVVFNGVDYSDSISEDEDVLFFKELNIPNDYILEIARVEYIKGQLNLISSLSDRPDIPIVLVGRMNNSKYCKKVVNAAKKRGNVFFISNIPHERINILYKNAALHVLPSLRESPGLVSLEAQALSCPIVVSDSEFLPKETYFSKVPYVIDPLNKQNMHDVILRAYHERQVSDFDFERFSWTNVAKQTYQAYNEVTR